MGVLDRIAPAWSSLRRFNAVPNDQRAFVFYAESRADWAHLGPIVEELIGRHGRTVCYVTSEEHDPIFQRADSKLLTFYVGMGSTRTTFFRLVDARVVVMTLPDLETFHLKRSVHPVHYAYVFHSMVSTHMIYRPGAFDAYDTVFCVGPHHVAEIRRTESLDGLPPKHLVEHGYGRLDAILAERTDPGTAIDAVGADGPTRRRVLLAPSWGPGSFIESPVGAELVDRLLTADQDVVLRLHPMTVRHHPDLVDELNGRFGARGLTIETDMRDRRSLAASDIMVSDWSGAALEYAFGLERPVLFLDMPRKVNNPEYERLGIVPIEDSIRTEVGELVRPDDLDAVMPAIERLCLRRGEVQARLREARERNVYNVGRSATVGAEHLVRLADGPADPIPHERMRD